MLYEFTGICQNCSSEIRTIVHNGEILENCQDCKEFPFGLKKYKGVIYVVSNPNQTGVKIGFTERTIDQRLKSLSSTGVPGKFQSIVIFPSNRPKTDEKKIHEKLKKKKIEKEHFDLSPVEAALKCYKFLNKRKPIFYDKNIEESFWLRFKQAQIEMELRKKGKDAK